jgi:hypothetical protein
MRVAWAAADEKTLLAALRPKVLSLHITCVDAQAITDPAELVVERVEQIDIRLYEWFTATWVKHLSELATLGNALRGKLFAISEAVATMEPALENLNHS